MAEYRIQSLDTTVRQLCSIEEQTANHHNKLTAATSDGSLTLPLLQGKGARQNNEPLVNNHRNKSTAKQDSRAVTMGEADQRAAAERQMKKKKKNTTHRPITWQD
jgi:trehalose-6-phosphate synthase